MTVQSTGRGCNRRARRAWPLALALPICLQAAVIDLDGVPTPSTVTEARQHLRSALESADKKDAAGARDLVLAVIDDPSFDALDETTRHAALALAAQLAEQTGNFEQAHRYALRATESTEQSLDDWRRRLTASTKLGDGRDEALCLTAIAKRWGRDSSALPDGAVRQVVHDTSRIDATTRLDLLHALYELRWRPGDGVQPGAWWVELCRLLLEQGQTQDAIQVASIVEDPRDIIAFRADRRFQKLLKSDRVKSDPRRAARDQIEELRRAASERPRSLQAVQRLIHALLKSRLDAQALELSEEVTRRTDAAGDGPAPYDDVWRFGSLLDAAATALRHLGRYDEAVQHLRRGAHLANEQDAVSQPIDLALLLCELDRPDDALLALPASERASSYGRMLIVLVQLTAAVERGAVPADTVQALSYLRAHRTDGPSILQDGLLRIGALAEAEQEYLLRLSDPVERTSALVEAQIYYSEKLPPRAEQWRERFLALKERPAVRAAIAQFGEVEHYPWTYGYR
jgi:tetratricopeptide (TPR) repeat protein